MLYDALLAVAAHFANRRHVSISPVGKAYHEEQKAKGSLSEIVIKQSRFNEMLKWETNFIK